MCLWVPLIAPCSTCNHKRGQCRPSLAWLFFSFGSWACCLPRRLYLQAAAGPTSSCGPTTETPSASSTLALPLSRCLDARVDYTHTNTLAFLGADMLLHTVSISITFALIVLFVTHAYTRAHTHARTHARTHKHARTRTHIHARARAHTHMCAHTRTRTHAHTHTHTHR